jgi:DNA polymerase elongation subunit (family B)
MLLYLYSCQSLYVRNAGGYGMKQIHLFFVDQVGTKVHKVVQDYKPYVLLQCDDQDMSVDQIQEWAATTVDQGSLKDGNVSEEIVHVDTVDLTPLMGFTNNRKDTLFRVHYQQLQRRRQVVQHLESGCPGGPTVLHKNISDEVQFLHLTKWRLQAWYTVADAPVASLNMKDAALLEGDPPMSIPPLTYVYLRIHAKSSTATSMNNFDPNHELPQDVVTDCELVSYVLGQETTTKDQIYLEDVEEHKLLEKIRYWLTRKDPCILVHASDPFDHVSYLHFRMKRVWGESDRTLSGLPGTTCNENSRMDNVSGKWVFRDLQPPGREVVDIIRVLEKFMVSPNLDGYTLLDAFRHPALLRNRGSMQYSVESVALPPRQRLPVEMALMHGLQFDNAFILNNLAFSATCDLSLFHIVSRGQQTRVFNCFVRAYHDCFIYINHSAFKQRHLVVKRARKASSYPDDPWLTNPPLASLRSGGQEEEEDVAPPAPKKQRTTVAGLFGKGVGKKTKTDKKPRYGGGFVIAPDAGFFQAPEHAVVTLDFASLYPSIMTGYKLCTMRLVYDEKWLSDPDAELEYVPLDDESCVVLVRKYKGKDVTTILDSIVNDVMQNRKRIRKKMVGLTDPFLLQSLDAQQLCAKVVTHAHVFVHIKT